MATLPLSGKTALVTGSSRGIGAAIAQRLAADGANVVVNYASNAAAADAVVGAINAARAGAAVAVQADAASVAGARSLVEHTLKAFGALDIVVLNSGIMHSKPLAEIDEAFYDAHFDANVKGPLFLTQAAAPHLKPGARVIFLSSSLTRASMVPPNALVYVATKAAVEQLCRVLAKDLGARGVTVNTVSPGPVDTELFRTGKSEQQVAFFTNLHPAKRLGAVDDISGVVTFLAGPEARWVNGQNLLVNGGFVV